MTFTNTTDTYSKYTVESVLEGHPDKVCDQISDAILDSYLEQDSCSLAAIECLGTGNHLTIGGEVFSSASIDAVRIAKRVYEEIGYTDKLRVVNRLSVQSEQLRCSILSGSAGDQGIMYGYACNSSYNYLPYGVYAASSIAKEIDSLRKSSLRYLPDGKVQITIENGSAVTLVISIQHSIDSDIEEIKRLVLSKAVSRVLPINDLREIFFNHNSSFHSGGFSNDTGLSGRKVAVDTYGGLVPHGGGAFSGKDPTKMDRSAAYMARFVAKNVVANKYAEFCLVSAAYVFGLEKPVMLEVRTNNPDKDPQLLDLIKDNFDFRPKAIIERLGLATTKYRKTANYGHFLNSEFSWENIISI
jgi:S-adenosylmethionine synthetase